jgi:catechol 2,3-dioxygenase-like lactoylglutathione lyase family enzyme
MMGLSHREYRAPGTGLISRDLSRYIIPHAIEGVWQGGGSHASSGRGRTGSPGYAELRSSLTQFKILSVRRQGDIVTVKRMDNVGIVVEDIDAAIQFFTELGLELEGRAPVEGRWADGVTGLRNMRVEIAMMRTPDGHSRLELSRFLAPPVVADHRSAPVKALGYLCVMFAVEDIDDTLVRLGKRGAKLVGEVAQNTCIGSATSEVPKEFSSGSPNNSGSRLPKRIR